MDLNDFLRIVRRRWVLVLVPVLLGLGVAWVTTPEQQSTTPVGRTYSATATIVFDPADTTANSSTGSSYDLSLNTVVLFAQSGEIPKLAAKQLGFSGEPQVLASTVQVTSDNKTGSMQISTGGADAADVTARVNAFAQSTVSYFRNQRVSQAKTALRANQNRLNAVTAELQAAETAAGGDDGSATAAGRVSALRPQYSDLLRDNYELRQVVDAPGPLKLLQKAVPVPKDTAGLAAPDSQTGRFGIAAGVALLLGLALALLVDRLDTRLHSRRAVEEAYDLPVLAEIPRLSRSESRQAEVGALSHPLSRYTEAYRELRSAIMILAPVHEGETRPHHPGGEPVVILVSSPRRAEGRSTVVANLAGVMSEAGQQVLVLDMDLRNPGAHELLGVDEGPGLSELMALDTSYSFLSLVRPTEVPGVEIITAGSSPEHPRALLVSAEKVIAEARRYADVVLIDSPAALDVTDAFDLAQFADVVVSLARQDRTSTAAAAGMRARFDRLNIDALGVVLVGAGRAGRSYKQPPPSDGSKRTSTVVEAPPVQGTRAKARRRGPAAVHRGVEGTS